MDSTLESPRSLDSIVEDENWVTPPRPETRDEALARLLRENELAFYHDDPVEFRQFPSSLYAHTEDGTPFTRLSELTRPASSLASSSRPTSRSQVECI